MSNVGIALQIMGMGMLGIFTAIAVIICVILIMRQVEKVFTRKK